MNQFQLTITCECGWTKTDTPENFKYFKDCCKIYIVCDECGGRIRYTPPNEARDAAKVKVVQEEFDEDCRRLLRGIRKKAAEITDGPK